MLQVRTYDVMITYDKYYQTPRIWLLGYDEVILRSSFLLDPKLSPCLKQAGTPLTPPQIFQDVSADHAFKTVTIEPFPNSSKLQAASVHPCKHASVMKKVIERMNAGVVEQQRLKGGPGPSAGAGKSGEPKKKWLGGVVRKVTGGTVPPVVEGDDDQDGMRVDFYLVVFLKFIASIVPTIEVDSTTAF